MGAISKGKTLSKLILFGEASLRRALTAFIDHYHQERNHQGKDNLLLSPIPVLCRAVRCCRHGFTDSSSTSLNLKLPPPELNNPHSVSC
jgi:hypothetical protein